MGQIHNELRKGWLSEAVNRALGRTREGGVERVSETCDVVLNPWGMPEWAYLRAEQLWGVRRAVSAGAAATFAAAAICNTTIKPNDYIVVVESIGVLTAASGDEASLYLDTDANLAALLTSSQNVLLRDTRFFPLRSPVQPVVRYLPVAVPGTLVGPLDAVQGVATSYGFMSAALPLILHPGHGAVVFTNNDAASMNVIFGGRTRKAYPGELP